MSVWSLLLRVVLSLALILNGSATAIAHAHAASQPGAVPVEAPAVTAAVDMPCHGQVGHDLGTPASAKADETDDADRGAPGCCESPACQCACVHTVHATLVGFVFDGSMRIHAQWVQPFSTGYPEPALPHLIRPPIG